MEPIFDDMPRILESFGLTIKLAAYSAVGALVLGTLLAVFRVSPVPVLRVFGASVVNTVRNTPLTLVLFFCLFALNYQLNLVLDKDNINNNVFRLAVLGLTVYHSTFVCEVLRSGINTVDKGQAEAARAVGLTFIQNVRFIVLPQAARAVIAPMGSVLIALTKNTTVAATIGVVTANGVYESSGQMKQMMENNGNLVPQIFLVFAFGFLCLTLPMGLITTWAAKRYGVIR